MAFLGAVLSLFSLTATALPAIQESSSLEPRAWAQTSHFQRLIDNERVKYLSTVTFGTQTRLVELDTGSSSPWLIQTGFECYAEGANLTAKPPTIPQKKCNFGKTYTPDSLFHPVPDVLQFDAYGSGTRALSGPLGYTNVSFCGFDIPKQLVGAPNISTYHAAGAALSSGLVGLAFPAATRGVNESDAKLTEFHYSPILETLFSSPTYKLLKQFSMVISRDVSGSGYGGSITIGSLPNLSDPTVNASQTSTSAKLQKPGFTTGLYGINVTSFSVQGTAYDANAQVIIDAGTPSLILPPATGKAFNAGWSPAGVRQDGEYIIDCNATNPLSLEVTIGGANYYINPLDLKVPNNATTCVSAVSTSTAGTSGSLILGDTFMRNVVSVFDWEGLQMTFHARPYYKS